MDNVSPVTFGPHYRDASKLVPKHCGETLQFAFPRSACTVCGETFDTQQVGSDMVVANGNSRPHRDDIEQASILAAIVFDRMQK
jgi:hypothetical protein